MLSIRTSEASSWGAGNVAQNPNLGQWLGQGMNAQILPMMFAFGLAIILGINIGYERWLYVFAIAPLPLILLRPVEVSLGIFAFLIPFDSVATLGGQEVGTTLAWYVGAGAAGVLLLIGIATGRLDKPQRNTVAWALFVGWSSSTALWALDQRMALNFLPTALSLLAMYFVAASLRITRGELGWILACTILGGVVAALYSMYGYYNGVAWGHGRSSLIIGNQRTDPNEFAASLLLPLSLAFGLFLASRRVFVKTVALAALVPILFSIVLTMSRGGILAVVTVGAVYAYRFRLKLRALVPVTIIAIVLLAAPSALFQRVSESFDTGGAGRTYIWKVGFLALKSYGIFGAGLGNFPAAFDRFVSYAPKFVGYGRGSHNIYLGTFIEMGIVGILLLVYALRTQLRGRQFADVISPFHSAVACEAASWGMLTAGLFLDILWRKGFWLVWILLAASTRLQESPARARGRQAIRHRSSPIL